MRTARRRAVALLAVVLLAAAGAARAGGADVAVAANFAPTLERLAGAFRAASGHELRITAGSTGKLYAQILAGAPYDLFLSADDETPARLAREGRTAGAPRPYAVGRLVLWSPKADATVQDGRVLAQGGFEHLAIANPKTAPYGAAALAVLRSLGLHERLAPRLVTGESVAQAYQFVATGNAELGFVALSQVQRPDRPAPGTWWLVPATLHAPLRQDAVLLPRGAANPAAQALLDWLGSPAAQALMRDAGYAAPPR